jgi:hypothetical protein
MRLSYNLNEWFRRNIHCTNETRRENFRVAKSIFQELYTFAHRHKSLHSVDLIFTFLISKIFLLVLEDAWVDMDKEQYFNCENHSTTNSLMVGNNISVKGQKSSLSLIKCKVHNVVLNLKKKADFYPCFEEK